jgi:DNA-binding GntR family transcriptional regulator
MGPVEIVEMLKVIVGLLFVALDDFPGAVDNADVARALIQARTQIEEAIVSSDYYRINEALCDYQVLLIELSGNGYLQRSMKKVHFTYYTRQVISYVDVAVTKKVAEPYPAITEALLADNVGLAKEIFLQARDRIIQPLTHLCRPG